MVCFVPWRMKTETIGRSLARNRGQEMPRSHEKKVEQVAVIGAGTMGHGIAQVAIQAGFEVNLYDADNEMARSGMEKIRESLQKRVDKGKLTVDDKNRALGKLALQSELREAVAKADLVIEAIPEKMELKSQLFRSLEQHARAQALLASNTSSLSINRLARNIASPERVLGLHFFNPPPVMKLVEIVRGEATSAQALETARSVVQQMEKEAIVVNDSPGFATSRLGLVLGLEAMRMVEQRVASVEDIDRALELGYGHPMGPLRVSDLVGLDVRLSIAETLHRELGGEHFRPPNLLKKMVDEGRLGRKTGRGFYDWSSD